MDIAKINSVFAQARYEQRQNPSYDVGPTQQQLRALVAGEPESDDKTWTLSLADKLADRAAPDEEVHIRALASPLERIQDYLQPPTFGSGA